MFVSSANTLGAVVSPAAKLGKRDIGIANGFLPVPGIWKDKDGNLRSTYKVKVRSQQYSFFGKNQKDEEVINKIDKEIKDLVSEKQDPVADEVPF